MSFPAPFSVLHGASAGSAMAKPISSAQRAVRFAIPMGNLVSILEKPQALRIRDLAGFGQPDQGPQAPLRAVGQGYGPAMRQDGAARDREAEAGPAGFTIA